MFSFFFPPSNDSKVELTELSVCYFTDGNRARAYNIHKRFKLVGGANNKISPLSNTVKVLSQMQSKQKTGLLREKKSGG